MPSILHLTIVCYCYAHEAGSHVLARKTNREVLQRDDLYFTTHSYVSPISTYGCLHGGQVSWLFWPRDTISPDSPNAKMSFRESEHNTLVVAWVSRQPAGKTVREADALVLPDDMTPAFGWIMHEYHVCCFEMARFGFTSVLQIHINPLCGMQWNTVGYRTWL